MLFAIKDELNATILRFTNGYAAIDFYDVQSKPWISLHFVQAMQVKGGLIISFGYDTYLPSQTMRFVSGTLVVDESTQTISVIDKGQLSATIRKAEQKEIYAIDSYLRLDAEEGEGTFIKHIESFIGACEDWNKFYVEDI